jgi:hypothetical protein
MWWGSTIINMPSAAADVGTLAQGGAETSAEERPFALLLPILMQGEEGAKNPMVDWECGRGIRLPVVASNNACCHGLSSCRLLRCCHCCPFFSTHVMAQTYIHQESNQ